MTEPTPDRGCVVAACRDRLEDLGRDPDFARRFVHEIAAPQNRWEGAHRASTANGGWYWDYPYRNRVLRSLDVWLHLTAEQQALLVAGVRDEGVTWRGEPLAHYLDIVNETQILRDLGLPKYRERLKRKLEQLNQGHVRHG